MPRLRGVSAHLWRLAAYQSAPSAGIDNGIAPGACAPSTSTATPRARHAGAISATGYTSALSDEMCSTTAILVRGPSALVKASTNPAGVGGSGIAITRTDAP